MASESKRQQKLIDSGFLDSLGSTKEKEPGFATVEKIFVKWMGKLLTALQDNLNQAKDGREISASGNLSESIRFEFKRDGATFTGEFYMAPYADFVDKGVQGIGPNNRNTTSPYHFRTAFPSKNMQQALILWIREKSVLEDKLAPKGLLGKNTRRVLRNKVRGTELAIRIGMGIKRHGTRATNFKQVSVDSIMEQMKAELATALAKDIRIDINNL